MPENKPPERRDTPFASEEELSGRRATLEKIGKELQFKLADIITKPFPETIDNLLKKLVKQRDRN